MNRNQFIDMLIDCRVPFECWGTSVDQKINELYEDFISKKRHFVRYGDDRLLICSTYIALKVRCRNLVLVQTMSETSSGPHPCPSIWTTYDIVPKNKRGIDIVVDWIYRTVFFDKISPGKHEFWMDRVEVLKGKPMPDQTYPGIWSVQTVFVYLWDIPEMFYDESGYIFETEDTIYLYEWMKYRDVTQRFILKPPQ